MRTYGLWDLALAGFYAWLGFSFVPSRSLSFNLALGVVVALLGMSGLALLAQVRWARPLGILASLALLVFAAVVIVGLVASSAYLRGVYGPLGRGMAAISLGIGALVVELFALVPLFQLRFLLKRPKA